MDGLRGETPATGPRDETAETFVRALAGGAEAFAPGTRVGPYVILSVIGEGGFGDVYVAEQERPVRRRVALKVIKPGMDSRAVIARFEQERQALAMMAHPNIATVFDAGATERGAPYFAMEYVKGEPITAYCDRHRLTIRQRLELFGKVCDAVQHAHSKGVIHRDLKPSNILVTVAEGDEARPVVIDFGVAKAISARLTERTVFTERGVLIGTPEYMSPEQAEMSATDIDTRTDVYALGVVLYELLTGALPFDPKTLREAGYAAIQKMIREVEPPRPSTRLSTMGADGAKAAAARHARLDELSRELRRELEWIPLKAMRKDRTERYRTAAELGDDVGNYLESRPLIAGPEGVSYRLRTFVRRNRRSMVMATVFSLLIAWGALGQLWSLIGVRAAERKATAEKDAANVARDAERIAKIEAIARAEEAVAARAAAESEAYSANLIAADASLAANEPRRVRARLEACPDRLRNWEWRWFNARCDESLSVFGPGAERLSFAVLSPNSASVLTVTGGKEAQVWDERTGRVLAVLRGHDDSIRSAGFSADGARVVTGSWDRTGRVWEATTGRELTVFRGHENWVSSAVFSPDGAWVVTASDDKTARVWEVAGGKQLAVLRGHEGGVLSAVFSADGKRVLTRSYDKTARVWNAVNGDELIVLRGHEGSIASVAFSPNGDRGLTASGDGTARVWDLASGSTLAVMRGHLSGVSSAVFSPDGRRVLTASDDKTARVWDASSGEERAVLTGHAGLISSISFSANGVRVVTGSWDMTARVWDADTGRERAVLRGHTERVCSAEFSQDGTRVLTGSYDKTARMWDAAKEQNGQTTLLGGHKSSVNSAGFNSDGTLVVAASADSTARVWDATGGRTILVLRGHQRGINAAAFDRDSTRLVTASLDTTARVWDAADGAEMVVLRGHERGVNCATFSPDGKRVLTASSDATARLWDAGSGSQLTLLGGHEARVTVAVFNPDGTRVLTGSDDRSARVWDAVSGTALATLHGHDDCVRSAVFSPDGKRVLTGSYDETARVWDAFSGRELAVLRGHHNWVSSVAFSADGTRVLTASGDGTARIWDAVSGNELAVLRGHDGPVSMALFSPDQARVLTASGDETARVWDSAGQRELAVLRGHEGRLCCALFSPDATRVLTAASDGMVQVRDSEPYRNRFPTILRIRNAGLDAAPLVRARLETGCPIDQVSKELGRRETISREERLALAAECCAIREPPSGPPKVDRSEAFALNNAAWFAVRHAPVAPEALAEALADARRAVHLVPDSATYVHTLAAALYRAGDYEESLATCLEAEDLYSKSPENARSGGRPRDWALIAMARWRLHQETKSRAALHRLRQLAATDRWKNDDDVAMWLREAEDLIEHGRP